jgi:16S rRNA (cytosine1402-N4)-methyltransferase
MVGEVLTALSPRAGGTYFDGTLGGGGHAEAILQASEPDGKLYGCDRDGQAITFVEQRLARFVGRVEIRRGNFSDAGGWVPAQSCDGALLDLGTSSVQLDRSERGFSFQQDGPLDMRMDTRQTLTAADLVNRSTPEDLARWFWELGGERQARRLARAIEQERAASPLRTTGQLAGLIERRVPRRGRVHPATRVFQALRMVVNDEMGSLKRGLDEVWKFLKSGGRLAVVTFHSGEDQIVKAFGRERTRGYRVPGAVDIPELRQPVAPEARWVSRKAVAASEQEISENPRSRSAQLRVLERI